MKLVKKKLVTIITETALEVSLIKELKTLGVKGYTTMEAQGEGARGVRVGDWDQNKNIVIKIICNEELASRVMQHVYENFYDDYALVTYLSDVEVYRDSKF